MTMRLMLGAIDWHDGQRVRALQGLQARRLGLPLAVMVAIDDSLAPLRELAVGEGMWRAAAAPHGSER